MSYLQRILEVVALEADLSIEDLVGPVRSRSIAQARHAGMWLAKVRPEVTGRRRSYPEVGRAFGGRDHTTVIYAVEKIEAQRERDERLRAFLARCEATLDAEERRSA